ncbi:MULTISPECIES: fimbrial protein [Atlantibacter]|uniref:fimbrial protein n=1 Tax=Atlantibacter TaxID=1903434 RepID=UPI001931DDA3|nr:MULTISPECIES: fimbrial protein [Atlantibacter]MBL7634341.1 type 1 fimbrial protein [Atlantibacter hermannii]MBL7675654.1 type 1 fimbrial protein [Atlantibacter hermannii]
MLKPSLKIAFCLALFSAAVQADPLISVTGNVVASPCTVDTNTVNKTVDLGSLQRLDLQNAGEGGDWHDFELLLTNCPLGTVTVKAQLSGTPAPGDATAWQNSGSSGNMALRITSRDHLTIIAPGSSLTSNVNTSNRTASFLLSAKMFTPQGNAVAGSFQSVMNVDFTWQ